MSKRKSVKSKGLRGRDARTGRFIPVAAARRRKRTSVVERVRKSK